MKPLAPQGEWLKEMTLAARPQIVVVFMGKDAEEQGKSLFPFLPSTLYLPFKTSPVRYTWPLHGHEVYLIDTSWSSQTFLQSVAECFFKHGATVVQYNRGNYFKNFRRS